MTTTSQPLPNNYLRLLNLMAKAGDAIIAHLSAVFGPDIFHMDGTEGTGLYVVIAVTDRGRVGFRDLDGSYRVRVEPLNDAMAEALRTFFPGEQSGVPQAEATKRFNWKIPGDNGQNRFSTVCNDQSELKAALKIALAALVWNGTVPYVSRKEVCPAWAKELVAECVAADEAFEAHKRARLIKRIREAKLPGCNACNRWSTATLQRKFVEADAAGLIS